MSKSEMKRKRTVTSIIVVCILALCAVFCAVFGVSQNGARNNSTVGDDTPDARKHFTFGQTYRIDGKDYTIGDGEDECIDYYTALELNSEEYIVNLTKYTYLDGTVRTDETTSVRNAGTYEFEVVPLAEGVEPYNDSIVVYGTPILIEVNKFKPFVNASSESQWLAHGDITTLYQHNDGWYFVQVDEQATIGVRTVTNSTYNHDGTEKTIKLKDEWFANDTNEKRRADWLTEAEKQAGIQSYYRYGGDSEGKGGIRLTTTSREGVKFSNSSEYVAALKFKAPENYEFIYGAESALIDNYRGLSVPEKDRTNTSFTLKKYWYIVKTDNNRGIGLNGFKNGGEPYSPFAIIHQKDNGEYGNINDYNDEDFVTPDSDKPFAITDTVTFGDEITINEPTVGATDNGRVLFSIEYESTDGTFHSTVRELSQFEHYTLWVHDNSGTGKTDLGNQKWKESDDYSYVDEKNTIQYYLNKYMPAGTYTLKIIYYTNAEKTQKITGEYKLYVVPAELDSGSLTVLHEKIRGDSVDKPEQAGELYKYLNTYALGAKQMHKDIAQELEALGLSLKYRTKESRGKYWATLTDEQAEDYYDTKVIIKYNREGYGGSEYIYHEKMLESFSIIGTYTVYYSISAKNYVTAGGADSADRTDRSFRLRLSTGVSINALYKNIIDTDDLYLNDGTYTGREVHTTVNNPNSYFTVTYDDADYVNVGQVSVTLTLTKPNETTWFNDLDKSVNFDKYFVLSGNVLKVYYNILPAENGWAIAPRMTSWYYDSFDKSANAITYDLRFKDSSTVISFRIGQKEGGQFKWLNLDGSFDSNGHYFTVDGIGQVPDTEEENVASVLNRLGYGEYYLDSKVTPIKNGETVNVKEFFTAESDYAKVNVMQTSNRWTEIPYMVGWSYKGFTSDNFKDGAAYYNTEGNTVTYTLYTGTTVSGEGEWSFTKLTDVINGVKVEDKLKALPCDTYTLVARLIGTKNYADLSTSTIFTVAQAENAWETSPVMVGWAYGSFIEGSFRAAAAKYNEDPAKKITYTLHRGIDFASSPDDDEDATWEMSLEVTDDGGLSEETVNALKTLNVGGYTLSVTLLGTKNYGDLSQSVTFIITQAANEWTGAIPSILGWTYDDDVSTITFTNGVAKFGKTEYTVQYLDDDGNTVEGYVEGFNKLEYEDFLKALVKDNKLIKLTAGGKYGGRYNLHAEVPEDSKFGNYASISRDIRFSVSKATNAWLDESKKPSIADWTYGDQPNEPKDNGASAKYNDPIVYTYFPARNDGGTWVINGAEIAKESLATAHAGSYLLVATVLGTDNYTEISATFKFEIKKKALEWKQTPEAELEWSNAGWKSSVLITAEIKAFDNYILTYTIVNSTTGIGQSKTVAVNLGVRDDGQVLALISALDELSIGTYNITVIAALADTVNYEAVSAYTTFKVSPAGNKWAPVFAIGGNWVWGEFDKSKLTQPGADHGIETIVYTVKSSVTTHTISAAEEGSAKAAFEALVLYLSSLYAGDYTIAVSIAETITYAGLKLDEDISFKVLQITTKWSVSTESTNSAKISWVYGSLQNPELEEPTILQEYKGWNSTATYTLKVDGTENGSLYNGSSWSALITELQKHGAGTYIASAHIAAGINHTALDYSVTVTVSASENAWKEGKKPTDITWTYGIYPDTLEFEAEHNNDKLTITFNNNNITSNFMDVLKGLNANETAYSLIISIAGDDMYGGLSETILLKINQADNEWEKDADKIVISNWKYSDRESEIDTKLALPVPMHGDSATVVVTYKLNNGDEEAARATINYADGEVNENDLAALISKLCKLGVVAGGYKLTITVIEKSNNYKELFAVSNVFYIEKATNRWETDPIFKGTNVKSTGEKSYEWVFGSDISAVATPRYGTVKVLYNTTDGREDEWAERQPANVGTYYAKFFVKSDSDNYSDLADYILTFEITGSENRVFNVSPGVTSWTWHNYDKKVNLFTGIPASGGIVWFEVKDASGKTIGRQFRLVNSKGSYSGNFVEDIYAPDDIIDKLNELDQGTYTLSLYVEAKGNYKSFDFDTTFNVGIAVNAWTGTPRITPWYYGSYDEEVNVPIAVSRYGTPVILITNQSDHKEYYNSITGVNLLATAPVGTYMMSVGVAGESKKFSGLSEEIEFQIFVNSDINFWVVVPSIEGWAANIDGTVTMPSGQPFRGSPYFVFYSATLNGNEYELQRVNADFKDSNGVLSVKKIDKGRRYAEDFYIPTAPGTYFMYSYAVSERDNDDLGENHSSRIMFTIRDREIVWEQNVRISSVLYLGEKSSWAKPTAKTNLPDADDIKYKYLDALTRRYVGTQIPTTPGKYIVVATVSARYTKEITSEMMFEVALSKNAWVNDTSPTIGNWSEEFSKNSPDPVGKALHGTVFYMYINKENPDIVFTDKPTAAGHYIMIARVELDGYETLEARYEFTIEPAFDETFLLIDIILGAVACIFAVVVIIFAIRRYKEN
ncbi:MAG: hypothetical protein J1G01_02815 [Clostridiales bacterium]|nr:hypothetical protein [Clostridiales bacterium]